MSERLNTEEALKYIVDAYGDRVLPCADTGYTAKVELKADLLSQLQPALKRLFSDPADFLKKMEWAARQKFHNQSKFLRTMPKLCGSEQCGDYEICMYKQANPPRSLNGLPVLTMHLYLHHRTIDRDTSIADFSIMFFPENKVGIVHRFIPPEYRKSGIGTEFTKGIESMVQRLADHTHQNHYATVKTAQPSVVLYFQGMGYVPADENQQERIQRMLSGGEGLFLAPAYDTSEEDGNALIELSDRGLYCFEGSMDSVPVSRRLPLTQAANEWDTDAFAVNLHKEFPPSQSSADVAMAQTRSDIHSALP